MNNLVWNEEKLNKLKVLWDEGLPITKIGNILGVSRNAIAGKAHRMGLPKRNSPISKSGDPRKNQKKVAEENIKELPLKILLRDVEWSRNRCCWPIGDPKLPGFSFCGTSIIPGRPYCEEHSNLAYTNTRES
jgi:GcrA cell cycle regulator